MKRITFLLFLIAQLLSTELQSQDNTRTLIRLNKPEESCQFTVLNEKKQVNVKADVYYYWYSDNSLHITQNGYSGKLLDGVFQSKYLDGGLLEKGNFKNGVKTGEWKSWYRNGNVNEILNWKMGKLHGTYYKYDESGRMISKLSYRSDQLSGYQEYYENGLLKEKKKFKNGKEVVPVVKVKKTKPVKKSSK